MIQKRFRRVQLEHLAPVMDERTLVAALNTDNHTVDQWVTRGLPFTHEQSRQSGKLIRIFDRELFIDWLFLMNKLYTSEWPEREAPFFIHNLRGQKMQLDKIVERSAEVIEHLPGAMNFKSCARHLGVGLATLMYWRDVHHMPAQKISGGTDGTARYIVHREALVNWLVRSRKNPAIRRREKQANVKKG